MPLVKNKPLKINVRGSNNKFHSGEGFKEGLLMSLPLNKIKDFVLKNGINFILNKAPLPELHLLQGTKKYSFCGPGTKLHNRIKYDDQGNPIEYITPPINELDRACSIHDIFYDKYSDIPSRNISDKQLLDAADKVLNNPHSSWSEKWNSRIVKEIMNYKIKNKS